MDTSLIFIAGFVVGVLAATLGKSFLKTLLKGCQPAEDIPDRFEDYWDKDTYTFRIGKFIKYDQDPISHLYTATINSSLFDVIVDSMDMKVSVVLDFSGFTCPTHSSGTTIDVVRHLHSVIYNKTGVLPKVIMDIPANTPIHVAETLRQVKNHALSQ